MLAVIAIWLSIVFFRMSSKLSESTTEAAKGIGASVERLEKLFDKLYADTFSMMRDTVTDMRKHLWPEEVSDAGRIAEEVEKRAAEKVEALKVSFAEELSTVLHRQRIADERISSVSEDVTKLVDRVIANSRQVELEARKETARDIVLRTLRVMQRKGVIVTAEDLLQKLGSEFTPVRMIDEVEALRREGFVSVDDEHIGPHTHVELSSPPLRPRADDTRRGKR